MPTLMDTFKKMASREVKVSLPYTWRKILRTSFLFVCIKVPQGLGNEERQRSFLGNASETTSERVL